MQTEHLLETLPLKLSTIIPRRVREITQQTLRFQTDDIMFQQAKNHNSAYQKELALAETQLGMPT